MIQMSPVNSWVAWSVGQSKDTSGGDLWQSYAMESLTSQSLLRRESRENIRLTLADREAREMRAPSTTRNSRKLSFHPRILRRQRYLLPRNFLHYQRFRQQEM